MERVSSPTPLEDYSVTPTLDKNEIFKLIAKQVALSMAAHKVEPLQLPPGLNSRVRQGTVLSTVEELGLQQPQTQDGPRCGTDA